METTLISSNITTTNSPRNILNGLQRRFLPSLNYSGRRKVSRESVANRSPRRKEKNLGDEFNMEFQVAWLSNEPNFSRNT